MTRPRRVTSAAGDLRLALRALRAERSHLVSAIGSHAPLSEELVRRVLGLIRANDTDAVALAELAADVELHELKRKREKRRPQKRKAA